ncbi:MAG TPA: GAF domain-containing protein, partial [Burkholderiales bacterium]|nr:GAF domain-containing protein [Burkholderiales bacterium]
GYGSLIALPLLVRGAVAGTLSLFAKESDFFDAAELELLNELAGNIAFAMENVAREEKLDKLSRIRSVSGEINIAIVRTPNRDALLLEVCRIAVEHGKFEMVWIAAVDEAKQHVRPVAWHGFSPETANAVNWPTIVAARGTLGEAIRTRKPAMRSDLLDIKQSSGLRHEALQNGCRSTICLPLAVAGQVAGLVVLFAPGVGFFDNEEMALLSEVAANVSFALGNFEKEERIARLSRIQALMSGINSAIVRARDRVELFNEACRIAVTDGKFGTAWIGTFDSKDKQVTPVAWAGRAGESLARVRVAAPTDVVNGTGVVSRAIREKQAVFDNDIASGVVVQTRRRAEAIREGFNSLVVVPFVIADTVVGHLSLYASEPGFFNEGELKLLNEIAGNISFALENIERQDKLEKLSRIRAVSGQINAAIVRLSERDALLKEVCRIAVKFGKFELVWIAGLDRQAETVRPIAWAGFPAEVAHAVHWGAISGAKATIAEAVRTGKISVRNDIGAQATSGVLREEALKRGCLSTVSLPLVVDGNVEAVIILYAHGANFFDHDELVLLDEVASDISFALQSIARRERLDYLAYYDSLTGLANRSFFLERVAQYARSALSGGHKLAVGLFDLERFKNINDSLGQPAGDALLKQVAAWITQYVGDANLVARVGADHFAIVLPVVKPEGDIRHLVQKTLDAFLDHPFRLNESVFRIAVKAGVALFPEDGADADTLFRNAEAALKKAKTGGDRYLFYTQKMTAAVAGRLALENQLRNALENEEFVLHYQPK